MTRPTSRVAQLVVCVTLLVICVPAKVLAADAETRAFQDGATSLQEGFAERAERTFADFVVNFPASPRVPEALLLQARAALAQRKFQPAVNLITTNLARAGSMADQYQYWLGRVHLQSDRFDLAAPSFETLLKTYTNSSLRLEASFYEAQAHFRLTEWARTVELLRDPAGNFQQATTARGTNNDFVVNGRLLLAEALLEQRRFSEAESVIAAIGETPLASEAKWRRQYLLCRIQFLDQRLDTALGNTTNLFALAAITSDPSLEAASAALQGELLEALNQPDAAIKAYERNQRDGVPAEKRREAFLKTIDLTLGQNRVAEAASKLEKFFTNNPAELGSDVALLTLGELRLKQHHLSRSPTNSLATTNVTVGGTNLLDLALGHFDRLIRAVPRSSYLGKAQLNRGWVLLEQGKTAESLSAFRAAADSLEFSEAQAVARFKLADLQFQSGDLTNAVRNYREVIANYRGLPRVQKELFDLAFFQLLQASVALGDMAAAEDALNRLLDGSPDSEYAEHGLLIYGQALNDFARPAGARKVLAELVERFATSTLRPEVELAIARTYERESNWPAAIGKYDGWIARFPSNEAAARAEYYRALAHFHAGQETNALMLMTNFVARFPTNALAARAQFWIGHYYYQKGRFDDAERNYQPVFENKNWPVTELTFQARLQAGRAALLRPSFENARSHFTNLIERDCPPRIMAQAYYAYGDAVTQRPGNATANFSDARSIFSAITNIVQLPGNDPILPLTWGRIGDCLLQLAEGDPTNLTIAASFYERVTGSIYADISARSSAEVGLGNVMQKKAQSAQGPEAMALLNRALDHYLNVVNGTNLRDRETPDAWWVKQAALKAADIAETLKKWDSALKLYTRLSEMLPPLRESLARKIDYAREQQALQRP